MCTAFPKEGQALNKKHNCKQTEEEYLQQCATDKSLIGGTKQEVQDILNN